MEAHSGTGVHPGHAPHHPNEHRHVDRPIDPGYRLIVWTVLWVIAGLVYLAFAIWWISS
jgi:hypothetical protein